MLPGMELMGCQDLAVPADVMRHVVRVESSFNPFAIGVVGGHLVRQPRDLPEALATVQMLEKRGFNFSLGLAQVNRYNLAKYGLASYEQAFATCPNLQAGSRILAECHRRAGNSWGKAFSCYYSGNFVTGYRHGYVQKVYASMRSDGGRVEPTGTASIRVVGRPTRKASAGARLPLRTADRHADDRAPAAPMTLSVESATGESPAPADQLAMETPLPTLPRQVVRLGTSNQSRIEVPPAAMGAAPAAASAVQESAPSDGAFVF